MDATDNLQLPYLMPSQAQKHVTHNEALGALDAVVQIAIVDRDLAAPPVSPVNGARYIVATGATGDWAGKTGQIAHRLDGAWVFRAPRAGWLAFVVDENRFVYWSGTAWTDCDAAIRSLQNLTLLGLGTTADSANPFSAKLNKALWTAKTAGEGGDGDLRYTLNKETASDVLSFLMQTGYSGRAEFGLVGDDNVTLKVSADGSSWTTALTIDKATGLASVAANPSAALGIAPKQYVDTATALKVTKAGDTMTGALTLPSSAPSGAYDAAHKSYVDTAAALKVIKTGDTMTGALTLPSSDPTGSYDAAHKSYVDAQRDTRVSKSGDTVAGNLTVSGTGNALAIQGTASFGGTVVATRLASFDTSGRLTVQYDNNGSFAPVTVRNYGVSASGNGSRCEFYYGTGGVLGMLGGYWGMLATDTWAAAGNRSVKFSLGLANAGSVAERFAVLSDGTLQATGNTIVDGNRIFRLRSYTIATLPSASTAAGQLMFCSDLGGGGDQLISDGTNWRRSSRGGVQTVATDAAFTLALLTNAEEQRHTGTLTADRAITLSTTSAYAGARFRVTRTGSGAFNLSMGGLKNLATNTWAEAIYDGTAWGLAAYGAL